ncbi:hypothetical protein [Actinocatenispora comari]|uniref:hypothetical protein n=1 Tax=Actinocatenispora comari TaxID=2807577 RepID=UPI001A90F363|nr:hypothetical protein [Actinocatenispora comari]
MMLQVPELDVAGECCMRVFGVRQLWCDDVPVAVEQCRSQGCVARREPFAVAIG